ncbi:hypothetical protein PBRA_006403 [Plasmodiophora brassicae]|uniref:DUF4395 domain-containing protein n=1 Tax=Plasmodiophora brassicae TaxID=37360 RepID=A0A0G4IT20_PLABS|nr:hypothetical protein PBRA_006403 [Plasmodiophora brassicae]
MFEKDAFPRFIKECTRRHNLAISRDMCFWWTRRPLRLFGFPNPVNQLEARSHSGCVTLLTILHIIFLYEFAVPWLGWYILYGFAARFLSGPRIDPQAYFVIFVVRPLLEDVLQVARSEFHPSPPKRFAQFVGLLFALAGNILYNVLHLTVPSIIVWGCLVVAAGLLALTGFCAACFVFSVGMRLGLVPKTVCESCAYSYTKSCPRPGTTARVHPYQAPTDTSGDET